MHRSWRRSQPRVHTKARPEEQLRLLHRAKFIFERALEILAETNLSFADACNVAYMEERELSHIYGLDEDFDRISGIVRVEPEETA
jgi:predicted nucleic acid-binding protein